MFKSNNVRGISVGICWAAVGTMCGEVSGLDGDATRLSTFQDEKIKINKSLPEMHPYYDLITQIRKAYGLVCANEKPTVQEDKILVDAFLAEGKRAINTYDVDTLIGLVYLMDRLVAFCYSARFEEGEWGAEEYFANEKEIISHTRKQLVALFKYLDQAKDFGLVLSASETAPDQGEDYSDAILNKLKATLKKQQEQSIIRRKE
jgi:hypothetical protein